MAGTVTGFLTGLLHIIHWPLERSIGCCAPYLGKPGCLWITYSHVVCVITQFMSQFLSLRSRRSAFHVFSASLRRIPARILEA